jgi:exocyst complex component 2
MHHATSFAVWLADTDLSIAQSEGHEVWRAIWDMVKNVSEVMISALPNFWRISKSFLDGKFKRVSPTCKLFSRFADFYYGQVGGPSGSRRSPSQCRTMALDIVKLYITLLSEFFKLSDVTVMVSQGPNSSVSPSHIPSHSNSFVTAHFLMKILGEVQDSVNEVNGMEISGEAASGLRSLLESTRWRFEDILNHAWLRGRLGSIDVALILMGV